MAHTRPFPVVANTEDPDLAADLGIEINSYAGPIGILGLLGVACSWRGLTAINLWVGVPDYLSDSPSPKAELALARAVERTTGVEIDIPILEEESRAWELGADEVVAANPQLADLVRTLEERIDATELPEASGEAIAAEFERYLRVAAATAERRARSRVAVSRADGCRGGHRRVGDPFTAHGAGVPGR